MINGTLVVECWQLEGFLFKGCHCGNCFCDPFTQLCLRVFITILKLISVTLVVKQNKLVFIRSNPYQLSQPTRLKHLSCVSLFRRNLAILNLFYTIMFFNEVSTFESNSKLIYSMSKQGIYTQGDRLYAQIKRIIAHYCN